MIILVMLIFGLTGNAPAPDWIATKPFDDKDQCQAAAAELKTESSIGLKVLSYCVTPGALVAINPQLTTPKQ